MKKQNGFTLVEISIVLVIIGLLIGGILKGQEMIQNAKYKNFVQQIDSYRAAVYAFQDRYKALPGDFNKATTSFQAPSGVTVRNGNGDGTVSGGWCDRNTEESCLVWQHLMLAGMIGGDVSAQGKALRRQHPYGGLIDAISTGNWANGRNELKILMRSLPGDIAQRMDDELDDGNATSGDMARYGGSGSSYDKNQRLDVFITL
ncbi:prepilin-type N-terminal cleavage/methylation domain-containing protein [Candidatus Endoriftia persephonae]|jgi:prepilin-type N-terminal cleavage/methylation domain-containing protein|uniref:Prokaryotic N-methylation site n=2 Tax=Gammaproteobacteria TaxID=1236 RepID=G2FBS4_9GAMM|nr:prepilin-type N-terminal cleavage/methylation domain-containing protein [Candidatus Endoriftia persephone]EGW55755.1 prokaryotic N-methylation site [endosymbiont of Tevnia jerichonana (vent Tica)]USF86267.1 prepilin-type N-terminal cleavage/methylation domain-containing protein [Candidatus Endoriftia persephone]